MLRSLAHALPDSALACCAAALRSSMLEQPPTCLGGFKCRCARRTGARGVHRHRSRHDATMRRWWALVRKRARASIRDHGRSVRCWNPEIVAAPGDGGRGARACSVDRRQHVRRSMNAVCRVGGGARGRGLVTPQVMVFCHAVHKLASGRFSLGVKRSSGSPGSTISVIALASAGRLPSRSECGASIKLS